MESGTSARRGLEKGESLYTISRPNTGLQLRQESLAEIKKKYKKVEPEVAEPLWNDLFASSKTECIHTHWYVNCISSVINLLAIKKIFLYLGMENVVKRLWVLTVNSVFGNEPTTSCQGLFCPSGQKLSLF